MREPGRLFPQRGPKGVPDPRTGTIVTTTPDLTWGTDGIRIETVDDGWVQRIPASLCRKLRDLQGQGASV